MSTLELVNALCTACKNILFVSPNSWIEITSSYSTESSFWPSLTIGLEQIGKSRPGSKDSELEGCSVQALRCKGCHATVGIQCVHVVVGKEIHLLVAVPSFALKSFGCYLRGDESFGVGSLTPNHQQ